MAGKLDRRGFLAAGAAAAVSPGAIAAAHAAAATTEPAEPAPRTRQPPIGRGGNAMSLPTLAKLARELGGGQPILMLDLAALDANTKVVVDFARAQRWAVRPALKSFRSPRLIAYLLQRLPEPRGLVFNLPEVDLILQHAPAGTDLMTGYPPTFGDIEGFLSRPAPPRQRPHTLRFLVDSVPLMEHVAKLARTTPRPLPLDIALEFDVGMGKGGLNDRAEIDGCLKILRAERGRLRLGAVLGYDGHATLNGNAAYRKLVALQAQNTYRQHLADLAELGGDLYDARTLIRNGPASSNYRNWAGGPANEVACGSAFLFASYLNDGYDVAGLFPALTMGGAVRRITSDHPSVPVTQRTLPGSDQMEIVVQGIGDAGEVVLPTPCSEDELSGGGDALVVPKGSVKLGDYVLFRPVQTEVAIVKFTEIVALREGTVRRRWPTFPRPGASA